MNEAAYFTPLDSGIAVIHSNKLEKLRDVVAYWLKQHPLMPLEQEVFLVHARHCSPFPDAWAWLTAIWKPKPSSTWSTCRRLPRRSKRLR